MKAAKEQCGRMASIHKDGKFGFIDAENGDSIFVLPLVCQNKQLPPLKARVQYDVVADGASKRFRADKVRSYDEDGESQSSRWKKSRIHKVEVRDECVGEKKKVRMEKKEKKDPSVFLHGLVINVNHASRAGHVQTKDGEVFCFHNPLVRGGIPHTHDKVYFKPVHDADGTMRAEEIEIIEEETSSEEEDLATEDPYEVAGEVSSSEESWPLTQSVTERVAEIFDKPPLEVLMMHRALQKAERQFGKALEKAKNKEKDMPVPEPEEVATKQEDEAEEIVDSDS